MIDFSFAVLLLDTWVKKINELTNAYKINQSCVSDRLENCIQPLSVLWFSMSCFFVFFTVIVVFHDCTFMLVLLFVVLTELQVWASEHGSLAAVTHNQGRAEVKMCLDVLWNVTMLKKSYRFSSPLQERERKSLHILGVSEWGYHWRRDCSEILALWCCHFHEAERSICWRMLLPFIEYPGMCLLPRAPPYTNANISSLSFPSLLICLSLIDIQQRKLLKIHVHVLFYLLQKVLAFIVALWVDIRQLWYCLLTNNEEID